MHAAMKVTHPLITSYLGNADDLLIAVFRILTLGPTTIARHRHLYIEKLERLAEDLRQEDDAIKASMRPSVRRVMQGKHVALIRALAAELGF